MNPKRPITPSSFRPFLKHLKAPFFSVSLFQSPYLIIMIIIIIIMIIIIIIMIIIIIIMIIIIIIMIIIIIIMIIIIIIIIIIPLSKNK